MNMKHFIMVVGFTATTALVPASAMAQAAASPVALTSDVKLDRVVVTNGVSKHVFTAPTKVVPGDHLIFSTKFHNSGAKPIEHFIVTNPLPSAVTLAGDGYGNFDVSVDGGKSWGKLAALTVSDGKGGQRGAQATDVTHVRWIIPAIAPGASGSLEYHAIVR